MTKRIRVAALCFTLFSVAALGQSTGACGTSKYANSMICTIPNIYGSTGLTLKDVTNAGIQHSPHFNNSFQGSFTPLTVELGTELSLLPLASPASGVLFSFDRTLGVFSRSTQSFGPVFAERAETVGRHKLYVGFTYQRFNFTTLDGIDLKNIPAVFTHQGCVATSTGGADCSSRFPVGTNTDFGNDFIATTNRISLRLDQYSFFASFGLTNRVDASIAVPIVHVKMDATSVAQIMELPTPPRVSPHVHIFPQETFQQTFHTSNSAQGIGDVLLRLKGTVLKGERYGLALGGDLRLPTGDEKNFLGTGAVGFKPFLAFSYRYKRISPHANIGYQWNGSSILAGRVASTDPNAPAVTGRLPDQLFFAVGADVGISQKLTFAGDFLGERLFGSKRVEKAAFTNSQWPGNIAEPQIRVVSASLNIYDGALGVKYSPVGNLLLTGNVLLKLNNAGLRATAVPLLGISYTF